MKNVDRPGFFVDGVDNPVLRAAPDAKQIGAIGCAREGKMSPGEGRLAEIARYDAVEPVDLLDSEFFAVLAEVDGELVDMALRKPGRCAREMSWTIYRLPPR
ncbi:MAG: hypothetical protein ACJ8FU_25310 [Xanthobacteraceae bacterium]